MPRGHYPTRRGHSRGANPPQLTPPNLPLMTWAMIDDDSHTCKQSDTIPRDRYRTKRLGPDQYAVRDTHTFTEVVTGYKERGQAEVMTAALNKLRTSEHDDVAIMRAKWVMTDFNSRSDPKKWPKFK
jgi:hypothetical protein